MSVYIIRLPLEQITRCDGFVGVQTWCKPYPCVPYPHILKVKPADRGASHYYSDAVYNGISNPLPQLQLSAGAAHLARVFLSRSMTELTPPSFSRVLLTACPMRLPNYRSSYRLKYHPYPMPAPSLQEDIMTVSYNPSSYPYTQRILIATNISPSTTVLKQRTSQHIILTMPFITKILTLAGCAGRSGYLC
jgi:hypothetical protein